MRDGVALADQVLARMRDAEELVGEGARAGVGRAGQHVLLLWIVQRVVEPRDGARGVAERRMRGDVLDPLAVDIDLAAVAQAVEILLAGERPRRRPCTSSGFCRFMPCLLATYGPVRRVFCAESRRDRLRIVGQSFSATSNEQAAVMRYILAAAVTMAMLTATCLFPDEPWATRRRTRFDLKYEREEQASRTTRRHTTPR